MTIIPRCQQLKGSNGSWQNELVVRALPGAKVDSLLHEGSQSKPQAIADGEVVGNAGFCIRLDNLQKKVKVYYHCFAIGS